MKKKVSLEQDGLVKQNEEGVGLQLSLRGNSVNPEMGRLFFNLGHVTEFPGKKGGENVTGPFFCTVNCVPSRRKQSLIYYQQLNVSCAMCIGVMAIAHDFPAYISLRN